MPILLITQMEEKTVYVAPSNPLVSRIQADNGSFYDVYLVLWWLTAPALHDCPAIVQVGWLTLRCLLRQIETLFPYLCQLTSIIHLTVISFIRSYCVSSHERHCVTKLCWIHFWGSDSKQSDNCFGTLVFSLLSSSACIIIVQLLFVFASCTIVSELIITGSLCFCECLSCLSLPGYVGQHSGYFILSCICRN